jgi:hypothetical protein
VPHDHGRPGDPAGPPEADREDSAATTVITDQVPLGVLTQFGHASAEFVARECGADVLHIKGAAVDPRTNPLRPGGTDADVLVRPAHVQRFMTGLASAGWVLWCDFDEGSRFEHAASLHHPVYGMLDVHQNFPGIHAAAERNFATLWSRRVTRTVAGIACPVLDGLGERLVLVLHAARTSPSHIDLENHWHGLTDTERAELVAFADEMGARVGLAVATGRADEVRGDPELPLWELSGSGDGNRVAEWAARWRTAPSATARVRLVSRALRVNRFVLAQRLGRPPTRAEVRAEWLRRSRRAMSGALRRVRP